jgi:hypothetical protein
MLGEACRAAVPEDGIWSGGRELDTGAARKTLPY